jgi:hypothetical protein
MTQTMSQPTPPAGGVLKPDYAAAPYQPTWRERINLRMIGAGLVGMLILGLVGAMFYTWAEQTITHGIVKTGDIYELNLKAMSLFEIDQHNARDEDIPSRWREMDGKKVALIGEIWQPDGVGPTGSHSFQLCYSIANCCFGGPRKIQHFVFASLPNDLPGAQVAVNESARVEGTLHVSVQRDPDGFIQSIYRIDVTSIVPVG